MNGPLAAFPQTNQSITRSLELIPNLTTRWTVLIAW
jgi:hypothetical protein